MNEFVDNLAAKGLLFPIVMLINIFGWVIPELIWGRRR